MGGATGAAALRQKRKGLLSQAFFRAERGRGPQLAQGSSTSEPVGRMAVVMAGGGSAAWVVVPVVPVVVPGRRPPLLLRRSGSREKLMLSARVRGETAKSLLS